jgi:hypothetical protein
MNNSIAMQDPSKLEISTLNVFKKEQPNITKEDNQGVTQSQKVINTSNDIE